MKCIGQVKTRHSRDHHRRRREKDLHEQIRGGKKFDIRDYEWTKEYTPNLGANHSSRSFVLAEAGVI